MENITDLLHEIIKSPLPSLVVILNLILIESLLSVDNAAVLATMVIGLPKDQRGRALRIGLIGAYFFRGLCLLFASVLISIWWFKPLGGIYLLFLGIKYFIGRNRKKTAEQSLHDELEETKESWLYRKTLGMFGKFWATVISVELMDLVFSIDNVIAANAYTRNIILIWLGVFIGILAMRFVAQSFVKLITKYPFLEDCAHVVIVILGMKLSFSLLGRFYHNSFINFIESERMDMLISAFSIAIFIVPVVTSLLFNIPRHKRNEVK
jgi:YkoY family integral membrane protein